MSNRLKFIFTLALLALPLSSLTARAEADLPSRPAIEGCTWSQITEPTNGLTTWVQTCDFGDRKIDLSFADGNLIQTYSDGNGPTPVVQVFNTLPGERIVDTIARVFDNATDKAIASRCVVVPYHDTALFEGGDRFDIVPNEAYAAEVAAKADPNDVPEPSCGELGEWPDGIQYWQGKEGGDYVMFVTVGQDEALFDEKTIHFETLSSTPAAATPDCCGYKPGPNGIDTDFVLQVCASPAGGTAHGMIPYFDCQSYLLAMLDTYKTLEASLPAADKFCLPEDFATADVVKNLYAEYDYDRDAQKRAPEVLLAYLHKTYPCAK